ncbi:hypothetical protein PVK06_038055 [Gossypium arboreum]|uniref:RING-type domain-containing protein n=1 Tax=Gossypium arboreum TaxID=29729 RepID=A0ABR0MZ84_GOSAR|nr:hypothetical protein PVK06_038055 [Gossypium arboreum]
MSTPSPSSPTYLTNLGLGYSIAIAVGFLVLLSTILLASYICFRSSTSPRAFSSNPSAIPASNSDGILLPTIIFVAEDEATDNVVLGLDQAVINSYPKFQFCKDSGASNLNTTCSICLCEYKDLEMLRMMPECKHYFHVFCIDAWLKLNGSCPVCRNSPLPTPLSTPLSEVVPLSQFAADRRRISDLGILSRRQLKRVVLSRGLLLLHNRVIVNSFDFVVNEVQQKLSGWEARKLLITLETTVDTRKVALLSWGDYCCPLDNRGLGLRNDWDRLNDLVPRHIVRKIAVMMPPSVEDRLLTNYERRQKHMTDDGNCPLCKGGLENGVHIVQDCSFAKVVWLAVVPRQAQSLFIAREKGFKKVEVYCDNVLLIELILSGGGANSSLVELRLLHQLQCRRWEVRVLHILRDQNEVADHMTKCADTRDSLLCLFAVSVVSVRNLLVEDHNRFRSF